MNDKLFSYLSNPIKTKLFLEIYEQKQVTTGQLLEKYNDIPQATLYRHLKKMLLDGVLKVVEENHIRGTVEKVYALGFDFDGNIESIANENNGEMYLQFITHQMLSVLREFKEYTQKADINLAGDGSGFTVAPVYATVEELTEAFVKVADILAPLYNNLPDGKRKLRNICIITTPPKS